MTDYTELKRLAEHHHSLGHAYTVATPSAVLALIAENERLHESDQEATELCDTLSALLGEIAVAVRGPEEPKSRHGFNDLPSRVKTVVAERDQLRAEVDGLRTGYEAYEQVNAELKAENEALRKDAARYEWLRQVRSGYIEVVEWIGPHATGMTGEDLDALLDAAMGQGERS